MKKIQPKSSGGAPDKKSFQLFNFLNKSMLQKQNILKVFLIAVFCLMIFVMADAASASTITINPDKTISVNGKKTFPVYMYMICNAHYEISGMVKSCTPSDNAEFVFSTPEWYANMENLGYKVKYEQAGVFYTLETRAINRIPQYLIDGTAFFGYYQGDEPEVGKHPYGGTTNEAELYAALNSAYSSTRLRDPSHPVILNHWRDMLKFAPYADIITFDGYPVTDGTGWTGGVYTREDAMYAWEHYINQNFFKGSNLNSIAKPVWAVLQACGVKEGERVPMTPREVRANTYTAITMDVKGIGYWSYLDYQELIPTPEYPFGTSGLYNNPSLHSYYRQIARELGTLNDILVLPTKDYSWHYRPGTKVSFSKELTKTVIGTIRTNFNYMLKQDGSVYYLIVLNKDTRSISNVAITVSGLNGPMTAKKIIGSSTTANQDAAVNNGSFTDSFDGLAVHVYQIYSGNNPPPFPTPTPPTPDTIDPAITITCPVNSATPPATPPTYSSNIISVSGTATDNVGVSKVEVKVGPSGAYQTATGTTSWSISGITIAAGLNMVYAKVTDTASPPNTKEVFIQVTYDATIPAPPTGGDFSINPTTHAVQRGGVDVFPLAMYNVCSYFSPPTQEGPTCPQSLNALSNFDYNEQGMSVGTNSGTYGAPYWAATVPILESHNYWYDTTVQKYEDTDLSSGINYSGNDGFFGFFGDEIWFRPEDAVKWTWMQENYPLIKAKFPNKLVTASYWGDFKRLSTAADVIQFDAFTHSDPHPDWYEATLDEYIFVAEVNLYKGMIAGCGSCTSLNSYPNKSIWIYWVAVGSTWVEGGSMVWQPVTPQEMRVEAYYTITTDAKGLGYWSYRLQNWDAGTLNPESLAFNLTQTALYNNLAGEIQSIEPVILLPTIAHSWGGPSVGVQNARVVFSPNPIKNMSPTWDYDLNYFSYNLKQSGNTYYLFVANKSSEDINNVEINISGLTGSMTAKVLGSSTLSYDAAGRTIPVSNGVFTDNFQGFAGRVYQIYSGPTAPPLPAGSGALPPTCTAPAAIPPATPPPPLPDTAPPTVPQKLTAKGSITVPAIDLAWRASTDDRGVAGYNIYRNGIKIATVNRLSYTDTDVIFGETHIYTVTAFDLSGNESAKSNPATAMSAPLNVKFAKATSASDFSQLIGNFLKWILTVAGSLALLIIITGGVIYISSSGDEQRTILAKKIVLGAIGGLILVLMAYSIITLLGGIV